MKKPIRKKVLTTAQKLRVAHKNIKQQNDQLISLTEQLSAANSLIRDYRGDIKIMDSERRTKRSEIITLAKVINRAEESLRSRLRVIQPRDHYAEPELRPAYKEPQHTMKAEVCMCERGMDQPYNPVPTEPVKTEECRLVEYLLYDVLSERHSESQMGAEIGAAARSKFGNFR